MTGIGIISRKRTRARSASGGETHDLLARLDAEWLDTCLRHDALALEWAAAHPALDGCTNLDEVVRACADDNDAAMLAVLERTQRGCPVAGRCLLRALVPLLFGLASHDPRAALGEYLGACWPVAMGRRLERTTRVLAGLALDTRRAVVRDRAGLWVIAEDAEPDSEADELSGPVQAGPEQQPIDPSVDQVVAAARRLRLVPRASADVLISVYADGLSGRDAATRHGISPEMVRYRCSHAVHQLRRHRAELLDDITA